MNSNPSPDTGADVPPPPRALKAAVLIMGILLIVGFFVVFTTIIYRTVNSGNESGVSRGSVTSGYGEIETRLPAGATVGETTLDGDRLVVRYTLGDRTGFLVLDVKRGHELGRFLMAPGTQ